MHQRIHNLRHRKWERNRRGATMVAALVAFAIAATILFYLLKSTLDQQRQMLTHRQDVQADWLAAAGIDRAIAQIKQSATYTGEIWQVPAEQLSNTAPAQVVIKVEPSDEANHRQITVQADYPAKTIHRSRKTRSYLWKE